jgi:PKD repeat protein
MDTLINLWKSLCAVLVTTVVVTLAVATGTAQAAGTAQDGVVGEVPSSATPYVMDGKVFDIAEVGGRIVVGGKFTQVRNTPANGGATFAQTALFAFDPRTGAVDRAFSPVLNGNVNALLPGPNGTVYVGGSFSSVNGATSGVRNLVQLSVATGQVVSTFRAPAMNGLVNDLALAGGRLYVGGFFSTMGGAPHGGLATLNPTTGAVSEYMGVDVAVNHNWDGSDQVARTPVGVDKFDITPDGSTLVVIGNFKIADGLPRDQLVRVDLGATAATVDAGWRTSRYEAPCFSWAYDSTVRDVQISPDGAYFSVVSSGGYVTGTLCDTVTRWELSDRGDDVQPRWADFTGGDSLFSVEITGDAIYTSGHQRWMNNVYGHDYAGAGAVPRPGISAHDPRTGAPLAWNPGRNPRGVGAEAMLATADALYIGMDTKYIGNMEYWRPGLAAFPLAGGADLAPETPTTLPANVYVGGALDPAHGGGATGDVLHRVNAGGPQVATLDDGPAWSADQGTTSALRNAGSNAAGYPPVPAVDGTVPPSTPSSVFDTERWDPAGQPELSWAFPVPAGTTVDVRVYVANRCTCTQNPGQRAFDVLIDGTTVLDDYDIVADVGHDLGTMKSFRVTSDGTVDLVLGHAVENPLVNAIEIVEATGAATGPVGSGELTARWFDGDSAGTDVPASGGGLDWSRVRGAFTAGGRLYYAYPTDAGPYSLWSRTFDGTVFGEPTEVLPYFDPEWDDVQTGSGNTYRGALPTFWSQLSSLTSMFLVDGRLYYTRGGAGALYQRSFSVDSGTVGAEQRTAAATGFGDVAGAFVSGDRLYWAARSTGALRSAPWNGGAPDLAAAVTEAGGDGRSWSSRALFAGPGDPPPAPNAQPTADFTSACTGLSCTFDGSTSRDGDGRVTDWAWDFGDGTTATGARPAAHAFPRAGDWSVTLTVTDDDGATGVLTGTVTVADAPPATGIDLRGATGISARAVTAASVTVPASVEAGDGLVLVLSTNSDVTGTLPAGWVAEGVVGSDTSITTQVFSRSAGAADAGSTVRVALSDRAKVTVQLLAYSGTAADPVSIVRTAVDLGGTAHTTPTATVPAGGWLLSVWSDKQAVAREWAAPAGVAVRSNLAGVGSGDVATLVADSGRAASGTAGGLTARVPTESNRATLLSIVLAPGSTTTPPPNAAPVAAFTSSCSALSCSFDGRDSTDDGSVVSYAWSFGDGATATGATVDHPYAGSGDYEVTLTVTDDAGVTSSATSVVPVAAPPPATGIGLRGSAGTAARAVSSVGLPVPNAVRPGDALVLVLSTNSSVGGTAPAGWTRAATVSSGSAPTTQVFERVAAAGDAGSEVTVALTGQAKVTLQLLAYGGTDTADPLAAVTTAALGSGTSHTTPTATAAAGSWVVSVWSDKQAAARQWAPPTGATERTNVAGVGSGDVATLVADSGGPVAGGTVGGLTATVPTASNRATALTVVLRPAS